MNTKMSKGSILIVAGPTASGKSALAMDIAHRFDGELINADSVQVYKRFHIGTAKPSQSDLNKIPHHLIDIVEPWEHFDGGRFVELADKAIADIQLRGHLPIVVGGTGMYIEFLLYGLSSSPIQNEKLREELKRIAANKGASYLYNRLRDVDPEYAATISPNDAHRIVRALEVFYISGEPLSAQHKRHEKFLRYSYLALIPDVERSVLYERIDSRFDKMIADGLVEEVSLLLQDDRIANSKPMESIGYAQIAGYLNGLYSFDEAVRLAKRDTRRYAKRQITWFKNRLNYIEMVDYPPLKEQTIKNIEDFLRGGLDS